MRSNEVTKGASCLIRSGVAFGGSSCSGACRERPYSLLAVGQASAATYPGGGSTFSGSSGRLKVPRSQMHARRGLCARQRGEYDGTAGNPVGVACGQNRSRAQPARRCFGSEAIATSPTFTATDSGSRLALPRTPVFRTGRTGVLDADSATYTATLVDKSTSNRQQAITETIEGPTAPFATKTGPGCAGRGSQLRDRNRRDHQIERRQRRPSRRQHQLPPRQRRGHRPWRRWRSAPAERRRRTAATEVTAATAAKARGRCGATAAAGGVSSARLESLIKSSSLIGPAVLKGNQLSVKAACPKKVGATCTLTLQGMLNRKKAATTARKAQGQEGQDEEVRPQGQARRA